MLKNPHFVAESPLRAAVQLCEVCWAFKVSKYRIQYCKVLFYLQYRKCKIQPIVWQIFLRTQDNSRVVPFYPLLLWVTCGWVAWGNIFFPGCNLDWSQSSYTLHRKKDTAVASQPHSSWWRHFQSGFKPLVNLLRVELSSYHNEKKGKLQQLETDELFFI